MENLTLDQAELIFTLFLAQNADKKISEFVEISETNFWKDWSNEIKQDLSTKCISDLIIARNWRFISLRLINQTETLSVFEYYCAFSKFNFDATWQYEKFDIMKYISLEDKV